MKKLLFALMGTVAAGTLVAADLLWTGAVDTDYLNGANWSGNAVPTSADTVTVKGGDVVHDAAGTTSQSKSLNLGALKANGGTLTLANGGLTATRLTLYGTADEPAVYKQSGGTLKVTDNTALWALGATRDACRVELSGGTIDASGTCMLQFPNGNGDNKEKASASWIQTGGTATFGSYCVLGRWVGDWGYMTLTGGSFTQSAQSFLLVGENGCGDLTVGGTAQLTVPAFLLGRAPCTSSTVRIGGNAVVKTGAFWCDMTAANGKGVLEFDGGTVQARADNNARGDHFIAPTIAPTIKAGGVTFEIPATCISKINAPLLTDATSTGGGLVKTGAGALVFTVQGSTYTGATEVREGTLVLNYPLTTSTLQISAGSTIGYNPANWSAQQVADLVAQVKSAGANLAIYTTADTTISDALDVGTGHVEIYGNFALTLTGNNTWTGDTIVYQGTLKAARGTGVPSASKVVLQGGIWAPLAASVVDQLEMPGTTGAVGFTAIGTPLEVNLNDGATLTRGANQYANGLTLNDAAADQPLVFKNPLTSTDADINVAVNSTAADAKVTMTGAFNVTNNKNFNKNGAGSLEFTGGGATVNGWYVHNAGTTTFTKPEDGENQTYSLFDVRANGGTMNIEPGATVAASGWVRFGVNGSSPVSTVNLNGGSINVVKASRINVGEASPGTFNINSGDVSTGIMYLSTGAGVGTVNQHGGSVVVNGTADNVIGSAANSVGVYNMDGGSLNWQYNLFVGSNGKGTFNQSGGDVTSTVTGWLSVGRYATGVGVYNLTGGTYTKNVCGVILGELGSGTLNISGTGVFTTPLLDLSRAIGTYGEVNIGEGGVLVTDYVLAYLNGQNSNSNNLQPNKGAVFTVDGGTVRARGTSSYANFFQRIDNIQVGPKGMTFDNNGNNVGFYGDGFAASEGTLTLTGAGTTTLAGKLPPVKEVLVKSGTTVNVVGAGAKELVHRWSFNGDLTDSVGGSTAAPIENGSTAYSFVESQKVKLNGGNKGEGGSLDLGDNLVPTTGPVTIEMWASVDADQQWSKALAFGKDTGNYFVLNACTSAGNGPTSISASVNGGQLANNHTGTGFATRGVEFHYVMTTIPDGKGGTHLTVIRQDATTGAILDRVRLYNANWNWANVVQSNNFLGRSYWADKDASMTVNELRIWKGAMDESEAIRSTTLGADTLPTAVASAGDVDNVLPENPSAELLANNYLTHRWSFNDGSLRDSVGGRLATIGGTVTNNITLLSREVLGGGKAGASSMIDLKSNLLPSSGPVTVEIWFTPRVNRQWSAIFGAGLGGGNPDQCSYLCIGQYCGNPGKVGKMFVCVNNRVNEVGSIPVSEVNKPYHIALTLTPRDGGGTVLKLTVRDLGGNLLGTATLDYANWKLSDLNQTNCWLGRSFYSGDPDASGIYDEVRVWQAALSDAQLAKNAQLGPDHLPALAPNFTDNGAIALNVEAGASVDLQGGEIEQGIVKGAGTVANGTLVVTGELDPNPTLTLPANTRVTGKYLYDVDDLVTVNGNVDLTGSTFVLRNSAGLTGGKVIMQTTGDGVVTGKLTSNLKGTGYCLSYSENQVKLVREGLYLIIR